MKPTLLTLALALTVLSQTAAADEPRSWGRNWRSPYSARTCETKVEEKPDELKREIKCEGGRGAHWHGQWKEEFRDGPCLVKIEATREVFKEEIKCDR